MSIFPHYFRSLLVAMILTFTAPIIFLGTMLTSLFCLSYLPGLHLLGQHGSNAIIYVLTILGSGYPFQGIITISITTSLVGGLFDLFNLYHCHNLGSH